MRVNYIDQIDCLEGLRAVPDNSVDLVLTDPPYGISYASCRKKVAEPKVPAARLIHPNEKPVALLQNLIETATAPGSTVLDPFMGSGTTAEACLRTGRNYIGFELDPKYHAIAQRRIADAVDELLAAN